MAKLTENEVRVQIEALRMIMREDQLRLLKESLQNSVKDHVTDLPGAKMATEILALYYIIRGALAPQNSKLASGCAEAAYNEELAGHIK